MFTIKFMMIIKYKKKYSNCLPFSFNMIDAFTLIENLYDCI